MEESELRSLLAECDREPIHIPGSIQPHGVLLACVPSSLVIQWVSANSEATLGLPPEEILGRPLNEAVGPHVVQVLQAGGQRHRFNPIRVTDLPARPGMSAEAVVHVHAERLIVELESFMPTVERRDELNQAIDPYLDVLNQPITASQNCDSIEVYLDAVVRSFRAFSGFDRVMAYRFHPDFSGEVVAEARREDLEPFLNLRYPASDIPQQARALYVTNILRVIPDIGYRPVSLLAAPGIADTTLDLSMASLRGVSPIHIEYMQNMGVNATLVASLVVGGALWGLIACHHDSPRYVDYSQRAAGALFSRIVSAQIGVLERSFNERRIAMARARLHNAIEDMTVAGDLETGLLQSAEKLLSIFRADGVSAYFGESRSAAGRTPKIACEHLVLDELYKPEADGILQTSQLREIADDAELTDGLAGCLAIVLSPNIELMLWRGEEIEIVNWAGKPEKSVAIDAGGSARLRPRGSFALWSEMRRGQSRPWDVLELKILTEFRSAFTSLLYRQNEELDRVNRELTSKNEEMESFIYSVSHDLKSPVVTMQSFVNMLREDIRDGATDDIEDSLSRIENATSRMSRIIEELLELSRVGHVVAHLTPVSLNKILAELAEALEPMLSAKQARLTIDGDIPMVMGDPIALFKLFDNLIVNAIKYGCPEPGMNIRVHVSAKRTTVLIGVSDDGPGIAQEHHQRIFALFQRLGTVAEGTGIGLSLVSKIARAHKGDAWVESEPGRGATFWVSLPKARA